jgi:hypothetical protein
MINARGVCPVHDERLAFDPAASFRSLDALDKAFWRPPVT